MNGGPGWRRIGNRAWVEDQIDAGSTWVQPLGQTFIGIGLDGRVDGDTVFLQAAIQLA
ncbi:hypothetical protein TPL01_00790 [Sulfuriferula plumbiphila]|uniref:Uncharacterized protein n=1 Tax=Sulfuriferula plumbiphila TaxID=171865 RepID=A0A512L403_9PROT|nr:hypothetical protein SFPGR_00690 [Sulfuriferula plumbiphila]GEP28941.1 hypothetical protein TPL01_00790 [Sulfuriferula plumbiphila]